MTASGNCMSEGSRRPSFRVAFLLLLFLWPAKKRRIHTTKPINSFLSYRFMEIAEIISVTFIFSGALYLGLISTFLILRL